MPADAGAQGFWRGRPWFPAGAAATTDGGPAARDRPAVRRAGARRALLADSLRLVAAGFTPAVGVVACAGAPPAARQARTLVVLAPPRPGREAKIAAWNRRYAEGAGAALRLEPVADGADHPALLAARLAPGTTGAQIVWAGLVDVPRLALQQRVRPIEALVRRGRVDLKPYMPVALQPAYGLDERLYALPEEVEARQVYFNRGHLAQAGIDYRRAGLDFERPAHTWAALRQVDLDLLAAARADEPLPFHPGHDGAPLELWGWQNGGAWLAAGGRRATLDRPENVAALAWLAGHARELGGADRVGSAGQFPPPARTGTAADEPGRHPFLAGRLSVCFETTRFVSTIATWRADFPLGYVEPPRRRAGAPLVSWSRAWGYALVTGAPDAAWDALRFLVSDDGAVVVAAAEAARAPVAGAPGAGAALGLIPGRALWFPAFTGRLALDRRLAQVYRTGVKLLDEGHDHGLEQLRHARFRTACPVPSEVWPLVEEVRRLALAGLATPQAALAAAQREAQARLDSAWRVAGSR